jgi:NAD(P)-dependent dehydrogenase (short-subunit alcohol dehydrogenase family)
VVLVTGAGTGIGRSLALAYAGEGAHVAIGARRPAPLEETAGAVRTLGAECLVVPTDVTREADCRALVGATLERWGRLDVLVNNAGAPGTDMPVAEMTLANWNETLAVNLTGPMLLTREALSRAMLPAGRGNVQFLSSAAARNVRPRKAHYAAAKLGLVALTQTLAHEVGDRGVRVNCIVVGLVAGDLVDRWVARMSAETGRPEDAIRAGLVAGFPVKRALDPGEIASVSLFLASDAASGITGQSVNVTNGALTH